MKKIIFAGLIVQLFLSPLFARRGSGDAVVGALGGLAVGTMIGHATADSSTKRGDPVAEEVRRIEDRQEMRREQDKERINRLERELERSQLESRVKEVMPEKGKTDPLVIFLMVLVGFLAFAVLGLGLVVMRRRL